MGNKNYTKFSDKTDNNNQNNPGVTITPETPVVPEVPTPETPDMPTPVITPETQNEPKDDNNSGTNLLAVVANCTKLNVRKEALKDAEVLCVINKGVELGVDLDASTEDFYKVFTSNNVEGYCVKDFIEIK